MRIRVSGKYACFTRPELKMERMTYDVITASAARGILESIYCHPGVFWHVHKIYVEKPIQYTSFMRNEIKDKIKCANVLNVMQDKKSMSELYIDRSENICQRNTTCLYDVQYVIEANFELRKEAKEKGLTDDKVYAIFKDRARKGKCFNQPYFGCREFPVRFKWMDYEDKPKPIDLTQDLGIMLYDMSYIHEGNVNKDIMPIFKHVRIENGVVDYDKGDELL